MCRYLKRKMFLKLLSLSADFPPLFGILFFIVTEVIGFQATCNELKLKSFIAYLIFHFRLRIRFQLIPFSMIMMRMEFQNLNLF